MDRRRSVLMTNELVTISQVNLGLNPLLARLSARWYGKIQNW